MSDTILNRQSFPKGGWQFRQPQTGWVAPTPTSSTFDQTCVLIQKMRLANLAITAKHQLSTNIAVIGNELEAFTRARLGIPLPPKSRPPRSQFAASLGAVAVAVKGEASDLLRAAQGTAVLMDWLSSGGDAVPAELAAKRAKICALGGPVSAEGKQQKCPRNIPGSWYTVAPAEIIKTTLEKWKTLQQAAGKPPIDLNTPYDEQLQSCGVCQCLMRLKVHCPLAHIIQRTKPEVLAEFPNWCWIRKRDEI